MKRLKGKRIEAAALLATIVIVCLVACSTPTVLEEPQQGILLGDSTLAPVTDVPAATSDDNSSSREDSSEVPDYLLRLGWVTDWTQHTIPYNEIISGGVPRDGIRSIDDPTYKTIAQTDEWLADTEPVIALEIDGEVHAYPLSILTQHEIVNDALAGIPVAVTFCPLCNASMVFDRRVEDQVYEFGVSGLLRNSDLVMYDRTTESLWQQFTGEGIVGLHAGDRLEFIPSSLISYADFKAAYPDGMILSDERSGRSYGTNPYQYYDQTTGRPFLYNGEIDGRLPLMMRTVGLDIDGETKAYAFEDLALASVVNDTVGGQDVVIFYRFGTNSALGAAVIAEAEDVGAATVFDPTLDGQKLTFTLHAGAFSDEQTGSTWNMLGQAVSGELAGQALTPLKYSSDFWFAWSAFHPETDIYQGS